MNEIDLLMTDILPIGILIIETRNLGNGFVEQTARFKMDEAIEEYLVANDDNVSLEDGEYHSSLFRKKFLAAFCFQADSQVSMMPKDNRALISLIVENED